MLIADPDVAVDPGRLGLTGETRRLRGLWQHWILQVLSIL